MRKRKRRQKEVRQKRNREEERKKKTKNKKEERTKRRNTDKSEGVKEQDTQERMQETKYLKEEGDKVAKENGQSARGNKKIQKRAMTEDRNDQTRVRETND